MPPVHESPYLLLVDDTPANLRLLSGVLRDQQYKVKAVPNGHLAIKIATTEIPDLILLDINMPDLDGYQVCAQLKQEPLTRDIPIIFISAMDGVIDKVRAFEAGGVDYVSKPIQAEEVIARVTTHLSIAKLQRDLTEANAVLEDRVEQRTAELNTQMALFRRFVPENFTSGPVAQIEPGAAVEEEFTVLSCDIRNFTNFSESVSAVECFRFLNTFFETAEPIIRSHDGFVYQYIGDEIVALFPSATGPVDRALAAAVEIQAAVAGDQLPLKQIQPDFRIGIGVNTGPVAIGIAGTKSRLGACAFGNTVNIAARCESLTKPKGEQIILTGSTWSRVGDKAQFSCRPLGEEAVRGLDEVVSLYALDV